MTVVKVCFMSPSLRERSKEVDYFNRESNKLTELIIKENPEIKLIRHSMIKPLAEKLYALTGASPHEQTSREFVYLGDTGYDYFVESVPPTEKITLKTMYSLFLSSDALKDTKREIIESSIKDLSEILAQLAVIGAKKKVIFLHDVTIPIAKPYLEEVKELLQSVGETPTFEIVGDYFNDEHVKQIIKDLNK